MQKVRLFDLVIFLPGIMGSVLQKDGKDVWAISGQAIGTALTSWGDSLQQLRLEGDDPDQAKLDDGIRATALMPGAFSFPLLAKSLGYAPLLAAIQRSFELLPGQLDLAQPANFYTFPYDWRRDNRATAKRLQRFIEQQLRAWRNYTGKQDAKVILIGHSMGGLVARYYAEVLEGWRDCRAVITIGTPHRGSVNAVDSLSNGSKPFTMLTDTVRTFTSAYQLLPIYKCVDSAGTYHRIAEIDGIHGIDRRRAGEALVFHRAIEDAVEAHQQDAQYHEFFRTIPIVGTRQPTNQSVTLLDGKATVRQALPSWIDAQLDDGDGTVPRLSATPIELSTEYRETFVAERHAALPNHPGILQDLIERVRHMQVQGLRAIRGPELSPEQASRPALALELEDLYLRSEPITLHASYLNTAGLAAPIARLQRFVDGQRLALPHRLFVADAAGWRLALDDLEAGLYQIEVAAGSGGPQAPSPVHDLFEVAG
jgi:pimeloyl-ACP methyl ester carboxylesterase